jgi:hypothetical protein
VLGTLAGLAGAVPGLGADVPVPGLQYTTPVDWRTLAGGGGGAGTLGNTMPSVLTSVSQSQSVGQSVTANPVTNLNLNTGGGALSNPQSAPYVIALGGAALAGLLGWLILR